MANITGSVFDDVIVNTTGDNIINTLEGNDLIYGGTGIAVIDGGNGFDTVDYSLISQPIEIQAQGIVDKSEAGIDQLVLVESIIAPSEQLNVINGWSPADSPVFLAVDLSLNSLLVNSVPGIGTLAFDVQNFVDVIGSSQADSIIGNNQNNFLDGQGGNDNIWGGNGNDLIFGFTGDDQLDGWLGSDFLYGEVGNDLLLGYVGDDVLTGGAGSDRLVGEAGNDVLNGYGFSPEEFDSLNGGAGADFFVLDQRGHLNRNLRL